MKSHALIAFIGGALVGAALALLLAPDSGKNTRGKIARRMGLDEIETDEWFEFDVPEEEEEAPVKASRPASAPSAMKASAPTGGKATAKPSGRPKKNNPK